MKRSEFYEELEDALASNLGESTRTEIELILTRAGVQWEPEEVEMPQKEVFSGDCMVHERSGERFVVFREEWANDFVLLRLRLSALEALARDLWGDLKKHHDMRDAGECAAGPCPTCRLLSRLQDLLGENVTP